MTTTEATEITDGQRMGTDSDQALSESDSEKTVFKWQENFKLVVGTFLAIGFVGGAVTKEFIDSVREEYRAGNSSSDDGREPNKLRSIYVTLQQDFLNLHTQEEELREELASGSDEKLSPEHLEWVITRIEKFNTEATRYNLELDQYYPFKSGEIDDGRDLRIIPLEPVELIRIESLKIAPKEQPQE